MAIELRSQNHLDQTLDTVLNALVGKDVTLPQARVALAQIITAAAMDNDAEVRDWLGSERVSRWKAGM